MDLKDLLVSLVAEEEETSTLAELDEEIVLFDLKDVESAASSSSEAEQQLMEADITLEREAPEQIVLSPSGIPFFNNDTHTLYTEDTLIWPGREGRDKDPFLSVIDPSVVKECITNRYFKREVNYTSGLVKYLFHTMCCSNDEEVRYASYNSAVYLLTTRGSLSYVKNELFLALVNLGGDFSILQRDVLACKSNVIPPPSCSAVKDVQISNTQLRQMLVMIFRFLSQCFTKYKNYTSQDADELIVILIAIALDPKVIDTALDIHIDTCIAHTLQFYSSEEEFVKRLKTVAEYILEYCNGDLPSVMYLCQACITPLGRGKILRNAIAFLQLQVYLKVPAQSFVADVQVKDIADLLTKYFLTCTELSVAYDSYYVIKLIDLCLHLDLIQPEQKSDLKTICDLAEKRFRRSQGSVDDMNPTISFQCLFAMLNKWKSYLTSTSNS